jgi:uncharacterized protein YjbJ (UPF0337 family)
MNQDFFESQWSQIQIFLREKWNRLTEEDLKQINGRYDLLISKVQQRYGLTRDQAEAEVHSFDFDRFSRPYTPSVKEEGEGFTRVEDNSALKWLIFAGIPLLLLAGYFANQAMTPSTTSTTTREMTAPATTTTPTSSTPSVSREIPTTTPVAPVITPSRDLTAPSPIVNQDILITDNLRKAFLGHDQLKGFISTLNFETSNGVVTITGSVPNAQMRDLITLVANKVVGVKQVINKVEIK